jgi:hypothetical protein
MPRSVALLTDWANETGATKRTSKRLNNATMARVVRSSDINACRLFVSAESLVGLMRDMNILQETGKGLMFRSLAGSSSEFHLIGNVRKYLDCT